MLSVWSSGRRGPLRRGSSCSIGTLLFSTRPTSPDPASTSVLSCSALSSSPTCLISPHVYSSWCISSGIGSLFYSIRLASSSVLTRPSPLHLILILSPLRPPLYSSRFISCSIRNLVSLYSPYLAPPSLTTSSLYLVSPLRHYLNSSRSHLAHLAYSHLP